MSAIVAPAWITGGQTLIPFPGLFAVEDGPSEHLCHPRAHCPALGAFEDGEDSVLASYWRGLASPSLVLVGLPVEEAVVFLFMLWRHGNVA